MLFWVLKKMIIAEKLFAKSLLRFQAIFEYFWRKSKVRVKFTFLINVLNFDIFIK